MERSASFSVEILLLLLSISQCRREDYRLKITGTNCEESHSTSISTSASISTSTSTSTHVFTSTAGLWSSRAISSCWSTRMVFFTMRIYALQRHAPAEILKSWPPDGGWRGRGVCPPATGCNIENTRKRVLKFPKEWRREDIATDLLQRSQRRRRR